jgi:hypothetical protein
MLRLQALKDLQQAYQDCFATRAGFARFKRTGHGESFCQCTGDGVIKPVRPASTGWRCRGCPDHKLANRPVRIRMSVDMGGGALNGSRYPDRMALAAVV